MRSRETRPFAVWVYRTIQKCLALKIEINSVARTIRYQIPYLWHKRDLTVNDTFFHPVFADDRELGTLRINAIVCSPVVDGAGASRRGDLGFERVTATVCIITSESSPATIVQQGVREHNVKDHPCTPTICGHPDVSEVFVIES